MAKMFQVRVRNMSSLQAKVKRLDWGIQAAVITALRGIAEPMENDAQNLIRTGKRSGRWVTRSHPTRRHQASAPGEPPANDMGLLANSIKAEVDPAQFNLILSAAARYARWLEYGTRHILPRPFLRPILARWRPKIINAIHDAIKGAL